MLRFRGACRLGELPRTAHHQDRPVRLVGFQLLVLGMFVAMAFANWSTSETAVPFSWDWFDVTKIETFGQIAAGISLSIFVYWGWDVCLTVNEETANGKKTAGLAGT